jgi:hypothetical protein
MSHNETIKANAAKFGSKIREQFSIINEDGDIPLIIRRLENDWYDDQTNGKARKRRAILKVMEELGESSRSLKPVQDFIADEYDKLDFGE